MHIILCLLLLLTLLAGLHASRLVSASMPGSAHCTTKTLSPASPAITSTALSPQPVSFPALPADTQAKQLWHHQPALATKSSV